MVSEPLDPSSWHHRSNLPRRNHAVPPASHLLTLPPQQPLSIPTSTHYNLRPPSQIPPMQLPAVPTTNTLTPTMLSHPAASNIRKRQYRFSVGADIALLRLVADRNPYGAPHGGRLQKWQAIADTLRISAINVDFRRARDRTALLIDQWRKQDFSLLRRSGSGNQHDQAEKERLLDIVSNMEHAAKPRDNLSDWKPTESSPTILTHPHSVLATDAQRTSHSPDCHPNTSTADNVQNNVSSLTHPPDATPSRPISLANPFSAPITPCVVGAPSVRPNLRSVSPPNSNAAPPHASLPPLERQRDIHTNAETAALQHSSRSQPLANSNGVKRLGTHLSPPHCGSTAARPCAQDAKHNSNALFGRTSSALSSLWAQSPSREVDAHVSVPNTLSNTTKRAPCNTQNIQLEAPACEHGRAELQAAFGSNSSNSSAHICSHFSKVEQLLQQILLSMQKKMEHDERRLEWEQHCERRREQRQNERQERGFRDVGRDEPLRKVASHSEERQHHREVISQRRPHGMRNGDHSEKND
ncbi:unnamed protein product [Agarophyton chilense]